MSLPRRFIASKKAAPEQSPSTVYSRGVYFVPPFICISFFLIFISAPNARITSAVISRYERLATFPERIIVLSPGRSGSAIISPLANWLDASALTLYTPDFSLPQTETKSIPFSNVSPCAEHIFSYSESGRENSFSVPQRVILLFESNATAVRKRSVLPLSSHRREAFGTAESGSNPRTYAVSPSKRISAPSAERQSAVARASAEGYIPCRTLSPRANAAHISAR